MPKKEKERKLTEAEIARAAAFDERARVLEEQGYRRHDLVISIVKANVLAVVVTLPILVVFAVWYVLGDPQGVTDLHPLAFLGLLAAYLVLIVVHELLHGLGFGLFAPSRWRAISFGVMRDSLTPYCACSEALSKGAYLFGALLPLVLAGMLPAAIGAATGSLMIFALGELLILGAGGDLTIALKLVAFRPDSSDVLYLDHPTECGVVAFMR